MTKLSTLVETFKDKYPARPSFAKAALEAGSDLEDDATLKENLPGSDPDNDFVGMTVGVEYRDENDNISKRWVSIIKFANSFAGYRSIRGFCFMREDLRTFRIDRIVNLFNENGQTYDMADIFNIVDKKDNEDAYHSIIETKHWPLLRDGLRVLIAVARSDGYMHPKEVLVITDYIKQEAERFGFPLNNNDILNLEAYINKQQPSGEVVTTCLERLAASDDQTQDIISEFLQKTIYADGVLAVEEIELSAKIHKRFNDE